MCENYIKEASRHYEMRKNETCHGCFGRFDSKQVVQSPKTARGLQRLSHRFLIVAPDFSKLYYGIASLGKIRWCNVLAAY